MANEENKRDYKGWISLVIGAAAVWIAYESFVWQKNQSQQNESETGAPGQQSTGGSTDNASSPDTYKHESTNSDSEDKAAATNPGQDKGNKKNNKKNK